MPIPLFLVAVIIISTTICYFVAKKKEANVSLWVVLGAVFGPLAVPFVFFAKPTASDKKISK
ncbi:hypothetical protein ORJ04_01170 [Rheinheimera baltica]|uniref:Cardiolipin synthase N-terminal domain-containing protein n=1 Tax=Rheinheimera baltica TaxID=67576 RepID=A0ABT9HTV5_9GAMM|nr:hypothetical protein [Rheinheimera baltica]MDP5134558.1 hypothetical protein [Rheinheimera baltica]